MRKLLILASVLAIAACSRGDAQRAEGEGRAGEQGSRSFQVGAFEAVSLEGPHDVVVTVGGQPSVRAEGDAEALQRLDIRVEGNVLKIGTERGGWIGRRHGRVTVHVTAPSLNAASIAGAGDLRVDRVRSPRFAASISGAGDMEIGAIEARQASFSITGAGDIQASGQAEQADVSIAGAGSAALQGFQTRRADVSVVGAGSINLRASEAVTGSIMGAGDVVVTGTARCNVSKMGAGNVRCGP